MSTPGSTPSQVTSDNNVIKKDKKKYFRFQYTQEELVNAINSIINEEKSLNQVHKETGIPKSTLSTKINNKVPMERKMGPQTILTEVEEGRIANWILSKAKVGFPVNPENVKDSIQNFLKILNLIFFKYYSFQFVKVIISIVLTCILF